MQILNRMKITCQNSDMFVFNTMFILVKVSTNLFILNYFQLSFRADKIYIISKLEISMKINFFFRLHYSICILWLIYSFFLGDERLKQGKLEKNISIFFLKSQSLTSSVSRILEEQTYMYTKSWGFSSEASRPPWC